MTPMQVYKAGLKDMLPVGIGALPFGMLAGLFAVEADFTVFQAMLFSIIIFAGASQLVGIELMAAAAAPWVIFVSAFFVNARFLMFSAGLAPHTKHWPMRWKILNSYFLVDAAYALAIKRFEKHAEHTRWYVFGCGTVIWFAWNGGTLAGALFGNVLPETLSLGFALPLTFIALLMLFIHTKTEVIVAVFAGGLSLMFHELPYNGGLMIATIAGVALGYILSRGQHEDPTEEEHEESVP